MTWYDKARDELDLQYVAGEIDQFQYAEAILELDETLREQAEEQHEAARDAFWGEI